MPAVGVLSTGSSTQPLLWLAGRDHTFDGRAFHAGLLFQKFRVWVYG